jgi:hypothetical protein
MTSINTEVLEYNGDLLGILPESKNLRKMKIRY